MIHISDIRKFERCPALLWRSCHEPQSYLPFVHPCASISDLAVLYFDLHDYFEGKANDDPSLALQALNEKEALVNARFEAQGVRVKITLMRKGKHGFHIYFGYRSCYPHESEAQQIADHLTVLKALGIEIEDVSILCLNAGYVRKQWLDVRTLLLVTDCLFNQKNKQRHTVQELCEPLMRDLSEISAACEKCLSAPTAVKNKRSSICTKGGKCRYFDSCFSDPIQDDSILYLQQSAHKLQMFDEGIATLQEADLERVEGFRFQYAQIRAAQNKGLFVDRAALRQWMDDCIVYPVTYLDFEWDTFAVPPYEGMKQNRLGFCLGI